MVIKKIKFSDWKKLKEAAIRYSQLGYEVECRGWNDISGNILTIRDYDFKDVEEAAVKT